MSTSSVKHWNKLYREVVQSSFLVVLKTQLDQPLSKLVRPYT